MRILPIRISVWVIILQVCTQVCCHSDVYGVSMVCPDGYTLHDTKCYRLYTDQQFYVEANGNCSMIPGGHLAVIDSSSIQDELETLATGISEDIYIGLSNRLHNAAPLRWPANIPFQADDYTNWAMGSPSQSNNPRCVVLDSVGIWQWKVVNDCESQARSYFCEAPAESILAPAESNALDCPYGFSYAINDTCYQFFPQEVTWPEAEVECQCYQGHLVSILSVEESDLISNIYDHLSVYPSIWIGLSKNASGNTGWSDGTELSFQNFDSGKSLIMNDTCVALGESDGNWTVHDCETVEFPFLCKTRKDLEQSNVTCVETSSVVVNPTCDGNSGLNTYEAMADIYVQKACLPKCRQSQVTFNVTIPSTDDCADIHFLYSVNREEADCSNAQYKRRCSVTSGDVTSAVNVKQCTIECECDTIGDMCHVQVFSLGNAVQTCSLSLLFS